MQSIIDWEKLKKVSFRDAFIIHVATLSVNLTLRVGGWVREVCD